MIALRAVTLFLASGLVLALTAAQAPAQDAVDPEKIRATLERQLTRGLAPLTPADGDGAAAEDVYTDIAPEDQVNIRITFDLDSAKIRDDQQPTLRVMCEIMTGLDAKAFQIIGHTDASGPETYNEILSQRRAEAVRDHLVESCAIPAEMLRTRGMGETAPYDPASPRSGINRRVEFRAQS